MRCFCSAARTFALLGGLGFVDNQDLGNPFVLHLLQLKASQDPALLSPDAAIVTVPTG